MRGPPEAPDTVVGVSAPDTLPGYRLPSQLVRDKEIDRIDRHCRAFIELSPWATLATADADGFPDVSPRGGEPGFVKVLDEHRLALPDRPGNNRVDSLRNVAVNPRVALMFLVPGIEETLRVFGTASIVGPADARGGPHRVREAAAVGAGPAGAAGLLPVRQVAHAVGPVAAGAVARPRRLRAHRSGLPRPLPAAGAAPARRRHARGSRPGSLTGRPDGRQSMRPIGARFSAWKTSSVRPRAQ